MVSKVQSKRYWVSHVNLESYVCIQFDRMCGLIALPVEDLYQDDPRIWNAIFEIVVADLAACERDGIDLGGQQGRIFPIVLANKGDWSYLDTWFEIGTVFWPMYST